MKSSDVVQISIQLFKMYFVSKRILQYELCKTMPLGVLANLLNVYATYMEDILVGYVSTMIILVGYDIKYLDVNSLHQYFLLALVSQ